MEEKEDIITITNPKNLDFYYNQKYFGTYIVFWDSMGEYPNRNYSWKIFTTDGDYHIGYFVIDRVVRSGLVELLYMNNKGEFRSQEVTKRDLTKPKVTPILTNFVRHHNYK
jgi:hypothetical protein